MKAPQKSSPMEDEKAALMAELIRRKEPGDGLRDAELPGTRFTPEASLGNVHTFMMRELRLCWSVISKGLTMGDAGSCFTLTSKNTPLD